MELDRRARDVSEHRLRRHAARILHRAPEARPAHRRAPRGRLLLGVGPHSVRRRRHRRHASDRTVDIPVPGKPMVHDCAITETSVLLFDLPCHFDLELAPCTARHSRTAGTSTYARTGRRAAARGRRRPTCGGASSTTPVTCSTRSTRTTKSTARVVVDVVRHPAMFATDFLGPNEGPTRLERWTLDPDDRQGRAPTCSRTSVPGVPAS